MPTLHMTLKSARGQFFSTKQLQDKVHKESGRKLSLIGRDIRQDAKRSIKPRKQKTLAEMSADERQTFRIRQRIHKAGDGPKPKKPTKGSAPGEAPRQGPGDELRSNIFYIYDRYQEAVLVGAVLLPGSDGKVPTVLEEGGTTKVTWGKNTGRRITIAPRPYMEPAYNQNLPQIKSEFRQLTLF